MKTILITSYSPCIHGSYGIVAREIFKRIHDAKKYTLVHHAWFHIDVPNSVPWTIIPTKMKMENGNQQLISEDIHGQQSFKEVLAKVKPDIVWALGDFYMLKHVFEEKANYPNIQFICHLAVDGEPWHRNITNFVSNADHIVAISKFGSGVLSKVLGKPIPYIHHGVDTKMIYPMDTERRHKQRLSASGGAFTEDAFVVGFVGKDQFRKMPWKLWEFIHYLVHGDYIVCNECGKVTLMEWDKMTHSPRDSSCLRQYESGYDYTYCYHCRSKEITRGEQRSKVYGYFHMPYKPNDAWDPGHLNDIWSVSGNMYNTQGLGSMRGLDDNKMIGVYNLMDMFYFCTGGEGFGIPAVECMAAGVPVMYSNYSALPELMPDCGIPVRVDWMCEMQSCYDRALINTADAVGKAIKIIDNRDIVKPIIEKGLEVAKVETWDVIGQQWLEYIDKVAEQCTDAVGVVV